MVGFTLAIAPCLTSCGKGDFSKSIALGQENMVRASIVDDPTSLDPALVEDGDTIDVIHQIFEGLVQFDSNNAIVPCLATGWKVTNGGKTYTFDIREGVKFSNGKSLDANAFKYAIERSCDPAIHASTAAEYLSNIVGVNEKLAGKTQEVAGVKVLAPYKLEIDLVKVAPYFLGDLTYPDSYAVCPGSVPAHTQITQLSQMIGTGPFIASSYTPDQVFAMKSNPNYWDGAPKISGIVSPIIKEESTAVDEFKSGQLDIVRLDPQYVKPMEGDSQYSKMLHFNADAGVWYVALNSNAYPPFSNRNVRRAFLMAIDTQTIVNKILDGVYTVATGIIPPGVLGSRAHAAILEYNPIEAKNLLRSAGYSDGSQMPPVKLYITTHEKSYTLVAQAIQNYLKQNLDVTVTIKPLDLATFLNLQDSKIFPMYFSSWYADYLDPQDFLSLLFTTNGAYNKQDYSNAEVDNLCEEADAMFPENDPKRLALYQRAEDIILQDAALLPVSFQRDAYLVNPRVHGLQNSLMGMLPFRKVWLSKQP